VKALLRSLFLATFALSCGSEAPPPGDDSGVATFGALEVQWFLEDRDGNEQTCAQTGLVEMEVMIGGPMMTVPCDDGRVSFEGLLPDRYPVVVNAKTAGGIRATERANAQVTAGSRTTLPVTFVLDSTSGRGDARLRWRVNGRDPVDECAIAGASRVRALSQPGSTSSIDEVAPCTSGEIFLPQIPVGTYSIALRLENPAGERIASVVVPTFGVMRDQIAEPPQVNLITTGPNRTRLIGRWTINSSVAADACDVIGGDRVIFTTVERPPRVSTSTTVDCRAGQAVLDQGIGTFAYTVRFTLHYSLASVTSTTIEGVQVIDGRTSTVTVDLIAD
jgi:hypothetical protein